MKSIQQKHVTDHRATYCYKPQRAILIIALQKISRFVFNGVPSKRFSFIKLHFYYTMNMEFFKCLWQKSVTPEMNRKHTSNQKPVFIFSTVSLFWLVTQKQQKKHPKSAPLRFRFGFYQFLHCSTVAPPAFPLPPPSKPALFCSCAPPCKFIKKIFKKILTYALKNSKINPQVTLTIMLRCYAHFCRAICIFYMRCCTTRKGTE